MKVDEVYSYDLWSLWRFVLSELARLGWRLSNAGQQGAAAIHRLVVWFIRKAGHKRKDLW